MRPPRILPVVLGGLVLLVAFCWSRSAFAQGRIEIEAVSGQPYGVGRILLSLPPAGDGAPLIKLSDKQHRVHFTAVETGPVRKLLRELIAAPTRSTVYFLFTGNDAIELSVASSAPLARTVRPRVDAAAHRRLLADWWRAFTAPRSGSADYPPLVDNYLQAMLAKRLKLPLSGADGPAGGDFKNALGLLSGTESMRMAIERQVMLGRFKDDVEAKQPVPGPIVAKAPDIAAAIEESDISIEPIAMHVPQECFYVRFGRFNNYLWLKHRLDQWGGDMRNVVAQRGVDYGLNAKMERQLVLKESALAQLLGETVISDVALIGFDTFTREGAAIGMLFQARSALGLASDIVVQRSALLKAEPDVKEEKLTIGGKQVSFVHSSDNSVRSFYAVDGDYHLVTTSRHLVERFLEAGAGKDALGAAAEFRSARGTLPVERNHTAFVYLSSAFQRNLLQPQYQIEMHRRLESLAQMDLLRLARLTARAAGQPADSVEQLVKRDYLPRSFGRLPDGSRLVEEQDRVVDSLRGGRGTYVPIPDVEFDAVTEREARQYNELAQKFAAAWGQMDPVLIGLERTATDAPGLERVKIDALASPLSAQHRQFLSQWIGPPLEERFTAAPDDLAFLQLSLAGGKLFSRADYQLFGALRDPDPSAPTGGGGLVQLLTDLVLQVPRDLRGYVGAWPEPGLLTLLGGTSNVPADGAGYSQLRSGIWRRQFDGFTVMSLHPDVLEAATPHLSRKAADRPAQVAFSSADLNGTKLGNQLNQYGYRYARSAEQSNLDLLASLSEHLGVAPENALKEAEDLLGAKLMSPLGGRYEYAADRSGRKSWISRGAASPNASGNQSGYVFPALQWLRGIQLEALMGDSTLAIHAEIDMPVDTSPKAISPAPRGATPPREARAPAKGAAPAKGTAPAKAPERPKPSD